MPSLLFRSLLDDETAQDLAEYGIALAVIAVGTGLVAMAIGGNVETLWTHAQTTIASIAAAV